MKSLDCKYACIVAFIFFYLSLDAQKLGIPEIEYFNRRQYHAGTQNWKISQSQDELLYIANNNGLLEYDGANWRTYNDMGDFAVRSVNCVDDRVYVGGFNEFGYFKYDSQYHFSYYSLNTAPILDDIGEIWSIHKIGSRIVFCGEKALCVIKDDQTEKVIYTESRVVSAFKVNEMLIIQDVAQGLMELRGDNVYPVPGGKVLAGLDVASMIPVAKDKIVIGTMKQGLFIWDMEGITAWNVPANKELIRANIFCGTGFEDKYLVFGTIQDGFIVTDKEGNLVQQFGKDKGLNNNTVLSVFVDREGNIWGGLDNGLARVSLNTGISFINGYYDIGTGYIMREYGGTFYLGTNQALYNIAATDFINPLMDRNDFKKVNGSDGQVWNLYIDDLGILCGHNHGVFKVNGLEATSITPPSVNGVWNFRLTPGDKNRLVCGTYSGLIVLNKVDQEWKYGHRIKGFNVSARFIEWDRWGNLWVSHDQEGVFRLRFDEDYKAVTEVRKFPYAEFSPNTQGVLTQVNGELVISGSKGLYSIKNQDSIVRYSQFDGFFSVGEYPDKIEADKYDNIWYALDQRMGVLRRLEDGTYKKIENSFLPVEQKLVAAFESFFVYDRQHVFLGIEDGFAHYNADNYQNYQIPFKVHVRSFSGATDNIPFTILQSEGGENAAQDVKVYPFKNNHFEVNYAASFFSDDNVQYSTSLSPLDNEPTPWSNSTSRQFTKLHEGEYFFTVVARNRYGVQSMPLTFRFEVLPPWHRHFYAKVSYLLLILIITFILTYVFNRRIEVNRQSEKLKARQQYLAKEEQLTNEALRTEKEMIKMRNDKLRSEMKFKEKELAGLTVHIIQKNNLLSELQDHLRRIKRIKSHDDSERKIDSLIKKIDMDIDNESNWQMFEGQFEQVHHSFLNRLVERYPDLTDKEKKLCAYIKMGMASKEIASLMNISTRSVENNRYKLRQKLGLQAGNDLSEYITGI